MWKRVIGPTVFVSLMWIVVGLATSYHILSQDQRQSALVAENAATSRAILALDDATQQIKAVAVRGRNVPGYQAQIDALAAEVERSMHVIDRTSFGLIDEKIAMEMRAHFETLFGLIRGDSQSPPGAAVAGGAADSRFDKLAYGIIRACDRLIDERSKLLNEEFQRRSLQDNWTNFIRLIFLVAGPALGILVGLRVAQSLHRTISQVTVTLRDARGNIEQEIGRVDVYPLDDAEGLPALEQQVQRVSSRIEHVLQELQQSRSEVISTERLAAVGELAAGVAHEVRNPLTAVKLLIQSAVKRYPHGSLTLEQMQLILDEILRIDRTIEGLLDFARPSKLHRVPHDLRETVRQAIQLLDGRARQSRTTVLDQFPEYPVMVYGDPQQIRQVFVNLLLNGIEAVSEGGELRVTVAYAGHDRKHATVEVRDNGPGIPEDLIGRLFEPFATGKEKGTGLGLAISRRIIQDHGGALTATNERSGGAAFRVLLPSVLENAGCRPAIANSPQDPSAS